MTKIKILKHCCGSEIDAEGVTQAPTLFEPGEYTVGDELARSLIAAGSATSLEEDQFTESPAGKALMGAPENKAKSSNPGKRKGKG